MISTRIGVVGFCFLTLFLSTETSTFAASSMQLPDQSSSNLTIKYDFETGLDAWEVSSSAEVRGITWAEWVAEQAKSGQHAIKLTLDLAGSETSRRNGEVFVTIPEIDMNGTTISAWVYAPEKARGDPTYSNGAHLFVEDSSGRKLYGTWQNILEGGWFQVMILVTGRKPTCGYIDPGGFDPTRVTKIGLNVGVPEQSSITFQGYLYLDAIALGTPSALASDHLYDFGDPTDLHRIPRWGPIPNWGAEGLGPPSIESQTLSMQAHFAIPVDEGKDEQRKGVLGIIYSPALDLSSKDHAIISADIRFDPPATNINNCPFVLSIGAYDDHKQKWFWSDNVQVGSGDRASVSFDLGDPIQLKPHVPDYKGDYPTLSEIRQIAFQLWANVPYDGRVLFDNIVIGGQERVYDNLNQGIVRAENAQFVLNGQPFRFVGANIEYLLTESGPDIQKALNLAHSLDIPTVRTWGFSDGCEGDTTAYCELWSRRFQPKRGQWNETAFEQFDRIVALAGERGIRLIVPLANNWAEYGGKAQYVAWLEQEHPEDISQNVAPGTPAYDDLFYTNKHIKQWYKDYVTQFISRTNSITGIPYNQDPTIFAWELINEPRAPSDPSGAMLHDWIVEMSEFINQLDPNHMIGTGEEGWYVMPLARATARGTLPDGTIWQNFPGNYWQYGVRWKPAGEDPWSSDGVDFFSDHSSTDTEVCWQAYAGETEEAPITCETRYGVPHIDFTGIHLYIDSGASSLYHAPYCEAGFDADLCNSTYDRPYHQAQLWVNERVKDALALGKPLIIGEFGFRTSGAGELASGQQPAHIPPFEQHHRAKMYEWYLGNFFDQGVSGALFWNLGIEGVPESLWDSGDVVEGTAGEVKWRPAAQSDTTHLALYADPYLVTQGRYSLSANYDPEKGYGSAFIDRIYISQPDKDWSPEYRYRLRFDIFSEAQASVIVGTVTGDYHTWYEVRPQPLEKGWNTITLDTTAEIWRTAVTKWQYTSSVPNLDNVQQISIGVTDYSAAGTFYVDNLRHLGDDGHIIYADDPTLTVIRRANSQLAP